MKAIVAERGQITIPKILRQKLGIKRGTVLDFEISNSKLIAIKADETDAVDQIYGCLGTLHSDETLTKLRGKHDDHCR